MLLLGRFHPDGHGSHDAGASGDGSSSRPSVDASAGGGADGAVTDSGGADTGNSDAAANDGGTEAGDQTPTAVTVEGSFSVSCVQQPSSEETDCTFTFSSLTSAPSPPAGMTVPDAIGVMAENTPDPTQGYGPGLSVTTPGYPSSCFQSLNWCEEGKLCYMISGNDQNGNLCGLSALPSANDFSAGFVATVPGTWTATGDAVPTTLQLTAQ